MKSSSPLQGKIHFFSSKKLERCFNNGVLTPFLFSSFLVTTLLSLFLLFSSNPLSRGLSQYITIISARNDDQKCDVYKGHWVPDLRAESSYTNSSCTTIPDSKNCFRHGRRDRDFLNWRWRPDRCELPRFDPTQFLDVVGDKTMAFIGDSVARNHMESLLCLLSQKEAPVNTYKDSEDRFRTWHFPAGNFTLKILWSKFLVTGEEVVINGSLTGVFNLQLDKVDPSWASEIEAVDLVVISSAHWFFRKIYIYDKSSLVGCVYCNEPNVTSYGPEHAMRLSFRSALDHINRCEKRRGRMVTYLRTFSPAHFESGTWDTGGMCNRTSPLSEKDINLRSSEWEFRNVQIEEVERAREVGAKRGKRFGVLDVTRAMLMRPDGHPGEFWGNKWMKGYNDCVHWCMPGPIDVWNDFLLAALKERVGMVS